MQRQDEGFAKGQVLGWLLDWGSWVGGQGVSGFYLGWIGLAGGLGCEVGLCSWAGGNFSCVADDSNLCIFKVLSCIIAW